MEKFQEYVAVCEFLEQLPAFCIENYFPWVSNFKLPDFNLDLPCIKKEAKIQILQYKKTPIFMHLSDGSKLFFTLDEFKRIHGNPEVGKTIRYEMIRLQNDNTLLPSMIKSCEII